MKTKKKRSKKPAHPLSSYRSMATVKRAITEALALGDKKEAAWLQALSEKWSKHFGQRINNVEKGAATRAAKLKRLGWDEASKARWRINDRRKGLGMPALMFPLLAVFFTSCTTPVVVKVAPDGSRTIATSARLGGRGSTFVRSGDTTVVTDDNNEKSFRDGTVGLVAARGLGALENVGSAAVGAWQSTRNAATAAGVQKASLAADVQKAGIAAEAAKAAEAATPAAP